MKAGTLLAAMLCMMLGTGCRYNPFKQRTVFEPSPVLFLNAQPTIQELSLSTAATNSHVDRMASQGAVLRLPGAPPINADISFERPLGFRFRAATALTGPEADFGSNNELFWFWIGRSPQPALFYARHDQFANSPARATLPVDPTWLIDAIGLTTIDPQAVWEGPLPVGEDRVEIRTKVPSAQGELTKSIVIHNRFGWILNQQLTDARGQVVASSATSNYQYYLRDGVALPQLIDVNVPALGAFTIEVERWQINSLNSDPQVLFSLPREQLRNYPLVDLTNPNGQRSTAVPVSAPPANGPYGAPPMNGPAYGPPDAYSPQTSAYQLQSGVRMAAESNVREGIRGFQR